MYKRRLTTRGIIIDESGKIFAQQQRKTVAKGEDWWCTPGGGVDDGESLVDGLKREMLEETGVAPEVGRLLFAQQFTESNSVEQLEFFFHITNWGDYKNINLSKTTHGELETAQNAFVDPDKVTLLPNDLQTINIRDFINSNQAVQFFTHL